MAIKQPPLAGVHVLVTRPAHQARMLCHLLEGQGAEVSCAPALQIVPLQSAVHIAAIEQAVASLDTCHIVIFVSVNAAELAIDCFLRSGVVLPDSL